MTNKQIAAILWKLFGEPLIFVCFGNILIYFLVAGLATINCFIFGSLTYWVARFLFYFGTYLIALLTGFTAMVNILVNLPESR